LIKAGGRGKSNILVERFHASAEFEALYQEKLAELKATLFQNGAAAGVLGTWVTLLESQAADLVDSSTVEKEAASISKYFSAD